MPRVTIKHYGCYRVAQGFRLLDLFIRKNIPIPAMCNGQGYCGQCRVRINGANALACRFNITSDISVTTFPKLKHSPVLKKTYALALDLGTTVIKGAIVDIKKGQCIRKAHAFNLQNTMGGDVITRIDRAIKGDYKKLRNALTKSIKVLKQRLGIVRSSFTSVAGNTVMLSFYCNKPVDGLASYPFTSILDQGFFTKNPARFIFPIIGSYVGGDVISGILASGAMKKNKTVLYMDLGTNGEVVLVTPKRLLATSTAAGPAFEGVGISCGSLAVPGAINKVRYRKGKFEGTVIGKRKPSGICASGLLDLLYCALEKQYITDTGKMLKPITVGDLLLTQNDVRKLQLAIGALRAGMKILLTKGRITPSMLDEIIITGEFGGKLNKRTLTRVGLIPSENIKVRLKNDLPLQGAIMALVDRHAQERINEIKTKSEHIELAMHPHFQQEFVQAMTFSSWK